MNIREGFIGGFLVLAFAVFIVGFLTGMLTIALMSIKFDFTELGVIVFVAGFMTGMVTITLVRVIVKSAGLTRKPS